MCFAHVFLYAYASLCHDPNIDAKIIMIMGRPDTSFSSMALPIRKAATVCTTFFHIRDLEATHALDLNAPSFSLGLGLDLDEPARPNQESHSKQCLEQSPIEVISSQSVEEDDDQSFQQQTLISDLQVDDPPSPPVFKRLKRGLSTPSSRVIKRDSVLVEDEIEDISSPEDTHRVMGKLVAVYKSDL
ncbi:hypothetical protein FRX31_028164 [Thalictrum thalictroides]|uniref:Uncharacterized protein n=1 Tax=Thalictrum thalictroides TaxID=46969 RepID=A0A7J6VAZ3_THATH|nr:hypothetical protein FRX31_028164 [Thalictrum thalictroides]